MICFLLKDMLLPKTGSFNSKFGGDKQQAQLQKSSGNGN